MIPNKIGYIGVLRSPYDKIDRFYTIRVTDYRITSFQYKNNRLMLMPASHHTPALSLNINKNNFKCRRFNESTDIQQSIFNNIDSYNFIFRNYVSGFYLDNKFYLLEASGKFLTEYDKINNNITDIEILQDTRSANEYRNKIDFNDIVKYKDTLYTVIGNNNIFVKYDIKNKQTTYIDLKRYNFTASNKFQFGLYSIYSNKIYLIPYNIPKLGIIDINDEDRVSFVNLDDLRKIDNLFIHAVEYNGYIYLIPYNSDFIYIYSVINDIFTKIDISNFKVFKESYKFVKAFAYNNNIILVSNKSNKLGYLDYYSIPNAVIEGDADFKLITLNLFELTDSKYEISEPITIGIDIKYSAIYLYGKLYIKLYQEGENANTIYDWFIDSSISISDTKTFIEYLEDFGFVDTNNRTLFTKYVPQPSDDNLIEFDENDFITGEKIDKVSINNIYSIIDDSIYFIPYNFKYLLKLELKNNILKIINISHNLNFAFTNYMLNGIGRFNLSTIVDNILYIIPYNENNANNYIPFVKYNLLTNTTSVIDLEFDSGSINLFSCVLSTSYNQDKVLYLIQGNGSQNSKNLLYTIDNNIISEITVSGSDSLNIIDGYIYNVGFDKYILLLHNNGDKVTKFRIDNRDTFIFVEEISLGVVINNKYSKIISNINSDYLYFIPFNTNKIGILNYNTNYFEESVEINKYPIPENNSLFKGGAIINLDNQDYLVMVPYNADRIYIYNINIRTFSFIKDPLLTTNKFENCTIDKEGNIYMNTSYGDTLFYKLSIKKKYKLPRLPVYKTSKLSFKYLFKKFHKTYSYENFNFGNKQIKFSDYYNNGGATYHIESQLNEDKYIIINDEIIPDAIPATSYVSFVEAQSNNRLKLQNYRNIRSSGYEDFIIFNDVGTAVDEYSITGTDVSKDNRFVYYVKSYESGNVILNGKYTEPYNDIYNSAIINKLTKLELNEEVYFIKTDIIPQDIINESVNTWSKVIIRLKRYQTTNSHLEINTSHFGSKFGNLREIEFDIMGVYQKGIKINIDNNINSNFNLITILNKPSGFINYNDGENNLIKITSSIFDIITVELKETINDEINVTVNDMTKLRSNIDNKINESIENKKVIKIIVTITANGSNNLDLKSLCDKLPYLTTLLIITTVSSVNIEFLCQTEIKNNLNVIVYENI